MRLREFATDIFPRMISYNLARKGLISSVKPLTITHSVTAACRSLCKTCNIGRTYLDNPEITQRDLSIDEIEKVYKSLKYIYFFNVSGGEPFMRLDLPEILKLSFIYLNPKLISIPTNSLAPKSIEKSTLKILKYMDQYLPDHVPLSIKPSIDGVGEVHDYIRGIKGNFVKLEETIDRLLAIRKKNPRLHVDLGSVISNFNIEHLKDLEDWVHTRGIESYRHEIAEQRVEFHNIGDPITPAPDVYKRLTDEFSDKILSNIKGKAMHTKTTEALRLTYYHIANRILKEKSQVTPCYGGLSNIHMDFDGEIWPCCILGGEQSMGNVRDWDYQIDKLLKSPKAKEVIKYITDKNCACPLASQWLNNIVLTPEHIIRAAYYIFIKFPFSGKATRQIDVSKDDNSPKNLKLDKIRKSLVLKSAGTIPEPENADISNFEETESISDYLTNKTVTTKENSGKIFKVKEIRDVSKKSYVLRIDRNGVDFEPGQYVVLGEKGSNSGREYTVYSSSSDDFLEFLITEVEGGRVSTALRKLNVGDEVDFDGPMGYFRLDKSKSSKHVFIATGSGIAPFHSMVRSNPNLRYTLIHGNRYLNDIIDGNDYSNGKYISCISRESKGDFHGRVTDYLKKNPVNKDDYFYICGNCDMLFEVYDILINQGVEGSHIRDEVFY